VDPKTTRGFLNNNPGNLDRGEPPWNGEIRDLPDCQNDVQRAELTHGRFCVFTTPVFGIRAIAKNLLAYHDRLGLKTIRQYINRWAPPNENNTEGYIQRVASNVGVGADDEIDIHNPRIMGSIIDGIIRVECAGQPYDLDEIEQGMIAAGIT